MATHHDGMETLFADRQVEAPGSRTGRSLQITAGRHRKLTPSQQTFNRLSKRIEKLQRAIQRDTAKCDTLLQAYSAAIPVLQRTIAIAKIALAKALGETTKKIKYGKRQAIDVRNAILGLCDEAFTQIEPDDTTRQFFDNWSESSYRDELESQQQAMKQMLSQTAREAFGLDIDFGDMGDTPEEMAQFAKRLESQMMDHQGRQKRRTSGRKKTRKQLEKEERDRQREQQQLGSIRSLYLSLAKALHPDTEQDPVRKMQKEELMKKVTAAYAGKDLAALLKLELEWVAGESHDLDMLSDEKLKLYIVSLKEQVAALEAEHAAVVYNPRYMPISPFMHLSQDAAIERIQEMAEDGVEVNDYLARMIAACSDPTRKRDIVEFAKEFTAPAPPAFMDPLDMLAEALTRR